MDIMLLCLSYAKIHLRAFIFVLFLILKYDQVLKLSLVINVKCEYK